MVALIVSALLFNNFVEFSLGAASSYIVHEAGHVVGAELTGTKLDWKFGDIGNPLVFTEYSSNSDNGTIVNASGLIAQVCSSEYIIRKKHHSWFYCGFMFWNLMNCISYPIDYWFIGRTNRMDGDRYYGDIKGIEYYKGDSGANLFSFLILSLGLSQTIRYVWDVPLLENLKLSFNTVEYSVTF